ncbi:hypothetical protein BaRGS_00003713 [Batillaria attramentaria]|uniref:Box C/D snoRNA protein 1 n=1 Tax=Batillaria attramentaria TaxID=370345 RepID=A0ABD0M1G9_9CAEN
MDEHTETATASHCDSQSESKTTAAAVVKCEVCETGEARYRCPGCLVRTCSLPCVKEHKECSGCNGKRDKTAYVPIDEFTETHLLSDYRLLEDTSRKAELTHQDAFKFNPGRQPFRVATFVKQARKRGVDLRLMPYPMTRRKINTSMFHYGLPDSQRLQDTVEKHIQFHIKRSPQCAVSQSDNPGTQPECGNSQTDSADTPTSLGRYTVQGGRNYCIFMRVEGLQANKERYYELDKSQNLCDNLKGKRLIEFPTLHVVPSHQGDQYMLLSKEEAEEIRDSIQRNQRRGKRPVQTQPEYKEEDLLNPWSRIFSS